MSGWCYGLVQENKKLILCEIYHTNKKLWGHVPVTLKELRNKKDRNLIIEDITLALKNKDIFKYPKDFKQNEETKK